MSKRRMAEATFIVMMLGMVSKVMGFAREQLIAMFFGATGQTDAYMVALMIGTLLTGVLSGPLSTAFLPVFASRLANEDPKGAWRIASSVTCLSITAVLIISLAALIPAPTLVRMVAPGFDGVTFDNTVFLIRILVPAMALALLAALFKAMLNSYKEFTAPGLMPVFQNLVIVGFIALFAPVMGVPALAIGTCLGYFAGAMIQVPALRRIGHNLKFSFRFDQGTKQVVKLAIPLMVGTLFTHMYQLVDKNLASHLQEGSIAALGFADRLRQLPLGMFVAAVVTVIYPSLSSMWAKKDTQGLGETMLMGLRFVGFICIPSAVGLAVLSRPVVRLVFERGAFSPLATTLTSRALLAYAPGLVAMAAMQVIVVAFYSSHETKVPVALNMGTAVINMGLSIMFVRLWDHVGLAVANSMAFWAGAILSLVVLRKYIKTIDFRKLYSSIARITVASSIMGLFAWVASSYFGFQEGFVTFRQDALVGITIIAFSVLTFILAAYCLRCEELNMFVNLVKEKLTRLRKKNDDKATD